MDHTILKKGAECIHCVIKSFLCHLVFLYQNFFFSDKGILQVFVECHVGIAYMWMLWQSDSLFRRIYPWSRDHANAPSSLVVSGNDHLPPTSLFQALSQHHVSRTHPLPCLSSSFLSPCVWMHTAHMPFSRWDPHGGDGGVPAALRRRRGVGEEKQILLVMYNKKSYPPFHWSQTAKQSAAVTRLARKTL